MEIRFEGRGGKGIVTASNIICEAAFTEGKYSLSIPKFGVERRLAPVTAHARIGGKKIAARYEIQNPDSVVVLDETLFRDSGAGIITRGLKDGSWIIINSNKNPDEFAYLGNYKIATVPATRIALNYGIGSDINPIVNTAILGAVVRVLDDVCSLDILCGTIIKKVPSKPEENERAAREAYDETKMREIYRVQDQTTSLPDLAVSGEEKPDIDYMVSRSTKSTVAINTAWRDKKPFFQRKISPCMSNCLAGQDVPCWLNLVRLGKWREAYQELSKMNPFLTLMEVCPHPCENQCNRSQIDEAVAINELERFIGIWGLNHIPEEFSKITKAEKVAVIGSGPAGLACAYYLRKQGYEVTIHEALRVVGGVPAYGIPKFRLNKEIWQKELAKKILRVKGINIRLGCTIDFIRFGKLMEDFNAIFVAVGASASRKVNKNAAWAGLKGVWSGLGYLKSVNSGEEIDLGKRVAVIGGGNTAMDAARTAKRNGADYVTVYYRRTREEMPANLKEITLAEEEGVEIVELVSPVEFSGFSKQLQQLKLEKMKLGSPDESGRQRPIPTGIESQVDANSAILAIGEDVDLKFLPKDWKEKGKIFIGGDADVDNRKNIGTIAAAIKSGREKAKAISRYLRGENAAVAEDRADADVVIYSPEELRQRFPIEHRVKDFLTLNRKELAESEAKRCISCGFCHLCGECYESCPDIAVFLDQQQKVSFDEAHCKGCGMCAEGCPTKAITMIEEEKNGK